VRRPQKRRRQLTGWRKGLVTNTSTINQSIKGGGKVEIGGGVCGAVPAESRNSVGQSREQDNKEGVKY